MIVVTGAAGFIASCLISHLNKTGLTQIVAVDDFSREDKLPNLEGKSIKHKIERSEFITWFRVNAAHIDFVYHIGARTDTTEFDEELLNELNLDYTKDVWKICTQYQIPLVYASSAATYGLGELGYDDNHDVIPQLQPLNPYGRSKNDFDIWALQQKDKPPYWVGLKFFNVYGPNEYHKGRMASVVLHTFRQVGDTSKMKLFRSHNPKYKDGLQLRDFVYVKDVISVLNWLKENKKNENSGIYNLGSGQARAFLDLAKATFKAMDQPEDISFVDTPADIRDKYQYFTEANMKKMISIGYDIPFHTLEEGVSDYVSNYLIGGKYY
ncbi:MAG: ADP-L-glycero-D-manno-heptose 6-epimerase [Flavobacteriales bacterium]|jgi:ADP-L-glycero-D-manno-heptose 6-epimerase